MLGFLGCDIGTTGTKTILFDQFNNAVGRGYKDYQLSNPQSGFFEQDPKDWYISLKESILGAVKNSTLDIKALSLSSQGGSFFLADLDETGKVIPLTPALTWMDTRATKEWEELKSEEFNDYYYKTTGWGFFAWSGICRLNWIKNNLPEIFAKTKIVISTSDYIYYMLTGKLVIDYTSASLMGNFNVLKKDYDEKLLNILGVDKTFFSKLVPTGTEIGEILPKIATDLGLPLGVKVYAGAHDQYSASIGSNYFGKNDLVISTGTTWAIFGKTDIPPFNDNYLAPSIHPMGGYGVMTSAISSGTVIQWTKNLLGVDYNTFNSEIDKRAIDPNLLVYPFISGNGTYRKKPLKYTVKNVEFRHDGFDIARATMEGVAFEIKHVINLFRQSGIVEDKIILAGGATKSKTWMQILSSVLDKEIYISNQADRCCFGAFSIAKKEYLKENFITFDFDGYTIYPNKLDAEFYQQKFKLYIDQIENL